MKIEADPSLGLETLTFLIERQVIRYQPEKFDALGPYLFMNYGVVINHAGPVAENGTQSWIHFRNDNDPKDFFVEPGDYIVIDENGIVRGYSTQEILAAIQ